LVIGGSVGVFLLFRGDFIFLEVVAVVVLVVVLVVFVE